MILDKFYFETKMHLIMHQEGATLWATLAIITTVNALNRCPVIAPCMLFHGMRSRSLGQRRSD